MKKVFPLFVCMIFILSACGNAATQEKPEAQEHAGHDAQNHVAGDLQEETASAEILPSFLDSQHEDIRLVYEVAGQATDILEWMPCYCGCGESAGHRSNLNCFIAETREDGSIVWDDHGTRCLVCLEIAIQSVQMAEDGKSLKEIRNAIDEQYKNGYAAPTPTEMPA
ncbi:hypothetical protein D1B33_02105 [Lysinibacillus yapensis]|uniref:Lipoprotein n=1 Tax=Ureibacillus yapensis TaxID=2304605 RepID=A0A396SDJ2_9BACL|nr:PCYCGC motif-containing (lipo)protein [Lysinibacillus yapensis]RHW39666.1 hypothetical protein D1B33_02105 [Lysinibacillus yapensis]